MMDRATILSHASGQSRAHRRAVAAAAFAGLALLHAAWAHPAPGPGQIAPRPAAAWTPSANAPDGLLTPIERERHDRFIERARAGDIDIVFFGTTDTEMWSWPDRGRSVWDRAFGSLSAANFGSQGTRFESLLWRMRNGELDGYQANLVVLQGFADPSIRADRLGAIIAEIRARQPQARILLFAPFPRGPLSPAQRQQAADANAARVAGVVDDETVFYADIGDRFFNPDGSFKNEMWSLALGNRGRQTPAFEVWAQALQPWIDRFVR